MGRRIAIVGGGIVGAVVASRLLEAAEAPQITLIDAGPVAGGASAWSAGVHFPVGRSARVKALGAAGARYYDGLAAQDATWPIHGFSMLVAAAPSRAAEVEERCVGLESIDPEALGGSPADLPRPADLAPGLALWRLSACHVADVARVAQRHLAACRGRADVREGTRVLAIDESASHATLRLSTGEHLETDVVVLAPGPWVNDPAFSPYTESLGVRIKKVVALHIDRPADRGDALYFPLEDAFLAPAPHRGHWLFSYTCLQWDVSPDELRHASLGPREIDEAGCVLSRVAPGLLPAVRGGRVFCDAYAPEREPLVCRVGHHGRIVFVGAANGSGYRFAPGLALEVAGLLGLSPVSQGV